LALSLSLPIAENSGKATREEEKRSAALLMMRKLLFYAKPFEVQVN